ncbi:MAG: 4-alpha-glucanotransferase [Muribaculaceae bacterium]|nr:4-alpha-glucanotransferase [Muribaculaceae bacterium]
MRLKFSINYRAAYGENLVLNILKGSSDEVVKHAMLTHDGQVWICEIEPPRGSQVMDYYYSVERDGTQVRHEWLVVPHRLDLTGSGMRLVVYDYWNDIPDDSYLYSSAFTDCVARRERTAIEAPAAESLIFVKVRTPQLRSGERLVMAGRGKALGDWNPVKALSMVEHTFNEWVAVIDAATLDSQLLEFKFAIADRDDDASLMWENSDNRTIVLPSLSKGESVVYELLQARFPIYPVKLAGTVIPIFSLRSEKSFGVGDFGDLQRMIDWVASTGQRALQVLPINDTTITGTWQDSYPYNSISIYALHPQYMDLNQLPQLQDALKVTQFEALRKELNALPQIDYERVNNAKREYMQLLYEQEGAAVLKSDDYKAFFNANKDWLVPYAAFCHYRDLYGTATFSQWPEHRTFEDGERAAMSNPRAKMYKEVAYWYFVQYFLDKQMRAAHEYALSKHVVLKGDIPIGISRDGVEAWVEPKYFNLNGQAGAPPDAFSANGQNWGFPTYNWDAMLADGCTWWVKRFRKMAQYFDAYRIDHVLGFFRIWEIPIEAVHGLLGQFSPSQGMSADEIRGYGLNFQEQFMTEPFIADWVLDRVFGPHADEVRQHYVERVHDDIYRMKPEYDTQRKVEAAFCGKDSDDDIWVRDGLYSLISDVLFVRDRKNPALFHPRISVQHDFVYETLYGNDKEAFNRLYNDYFYRRNNDFWYHEAMKKLPKLVQATRMLVCAEDLGMVPDCVAWVMNELRILSLEIQSMPKDEKLQFGNLNSNPYRSVATISTHDMSTLRQWWDEDPELTQQYYSSVLWRGDAAPHPLPGWLAGDIVRNHLSCPSMLCLLSLQDWMAIDDHLRLADADAERINIPANPRHYWRYRMHLSIEDLMGATSFNAKIKDMINQSGRK